MLSIIDTLKPRTRLAWAMLIAALVVAGLELVAIIHTAAGLAPAAVTLAQAATLSENDLQAGVVETFIMESPILERAKLKEIEGNAYSYNAEGTLPGIEFRAVNAAYSESTGAVNQSSESLVILGGDADVDNFIIKTRSNVNDQKATQTALKVKAAAYKFQETFINGDVAVDANSFDGLKKRLTGAQVITAGTNGLPIVGTTSADRHAFLDQIDALIAAVPGLTGENGVLLMNDLVKAKLIGSARRELITTTTRDDFGRPIERYRDIPMVDIGTNAAGTRILPQTETQGTATDASSVYAVKFGADEAERGATVLYNGPPTVFDVRDLGELQAKPSERVRIEGFLGLALFGGKAAARLQGVRAV